MRNGRKRVCPIITVLSIDGGGVRGIIPALFLEEIEKQTGRPICRLFDYIAGTSTGGIIAAMLTVANEQGKPRYTAKDVRQAYQDYAGEIFHRSILRRLITGDGLLRSRYSARPLEQYLNRFLGSVRLHETLTELLIPAYEMESDTPWFFKSAYAARHPKTIDDPLLAQAVRATTAAPTYFSSCRFSPKRCFVDGGVFANNPALCAYAEARRRFPREREFLIVSLGTGEQRDQDAARRTENGGILKWAIPIFKVLANSASGTVDYQMKALAGEDKYYRFQVRLGSHAAGMDNAGAKNIKQLEMLARTEIVHHGDKLAQLCLILNKYPASN